MTGDGGGSGTGEVEIVRLRPRPDGPAAPTPGDAVAAGGATVDEDAAGAAEPPATEPQEAAAEPQDPTAAVPAGSDPHLARLERRLAAVQHALEGLPRAIREAVDDAVAEQLPAAADVVRARVVDELPGRVADRLGPLRDEVTGAVAALSGIAASLERSASSLAEVTGTLAGTVARLGEEDATAALERTVAAIRDLGADIAAHRRDLADLAPDDHDVVLEALERTVAGLRPRHRRRFAEELASLARERPAAPATPTPSVHGSAPPVAPAAGRTVAVAGGPTSPPTPVVGETRERVTLVDPHRVTTSPETSSSLERATGLAVPDGAPAGAAGDVDVDDQGAPPEDAPPEGAPPDDAPWEGALPEDAPPEETIGEDETAELPALTPTDDPTSAAAPADAEAADPAEIDVAAREDVEVADPDDTEVADPVDVEVADPDDTEVADAEVASLDEVVAVRPDGDVAGAPVAPDADGEGSEDATTSPAADGDGDVPLWQAAGYASPRAELLDWVGEVPGVGKARAERLADIYPDLDALAAAPDEEVAALPGFSARLAAAVLDHVRA